MICVLTGPIQSGKTSTLEAILEQVIDRGIVAHGFLSRRVLEKGETVGYDLFDLQERNGIPFLRKTGKADWQRIGPWSLIPSGLERAEKIIREGKEADLLVVDEVGPLELEGGGLWPALERDVLGREGLSLLVVRERLLESFEKILKGRPMRVFHPEAEPLLRFLLEELGR
jgi:nucleoside-triphosphatase THEP1